MSVMQVDQITNAAGTAGPTFPFGASGVLVASASTQGVAVEVSRASPNSTDVQNLYSGVYTPASTGITNVANSITFSMIWFRVGNMVNVAGRFDVIPTAAGNTDTQCSISLPITMGSNFSSNDTQAGGEAVDHVHEQVAAIYAFNGNKRVLFQFNANTTAQSSFFLNFTYQIQP